MNGKQIFEEEIGDFITHLEIHNWDKISIKLGNGKQIYRNKTKLMRNNYI